MGRVVDVFADVACPFTHASLRIITGTRDAQGSDTRFRVRSWPLALTGPGIAPKVAALREEVAPSLFTGFDPERFPTSTRAALAAEQAAYGVSLEEGERVALLLRDALFERGLDVSDPEVLASRGVPPGDAAAVDADRAEGERRGVRGSPHYFSGEEDFFCPLLDIGDVVRFDRHGFERFAAKVL
jgi:hypothetical protein